MDFGVRAPSVVVWGHLEPNGVLTIVDEYAETGRTLGEHVAAIKSRAWGGGPPAWIGIDPAGTARNEQDRPEQLPRDAEHAHADQGAPDAHRAGD